MHASLWTCTHLEFSIDINIDAFLATYWWLTVHTSRDVAAMLKVIAGGRPEQLPTMSPPLWQLVTSAWAPDFRHVVPQPPHSRPSRRNVLPPSDTKPIWSIVASGVDGAVLAAWSCYRDAP